MHSSPKHELHLSSIGFEELHEVLGVKTPCETLRPKNKRRGSGSNFTLIWNNTYVHKCHTFKIYTVYIYMYKLCTYILLLEGIMC